MGTIIERFANGEIAAVFPDFEPGQPVRVLPDTVGAYEVTEDTVARETGWVFVGPTRHPCYAVIRETRYGTTVHTDRNRLVGR